MAEPFITETFLNFVVGTSEAAKTFKQLGAEVVKADLDDPASLKSVLRGCTPS